MKKHDLLAAAALLAYIVMVAVNAMANLLPINGLSTKDVSDRYFNLFTPAGITFSIWSVIYLLLAGFVFTAWTRRHTHFIQALLPWFVASCLLNAAWILAWHYLLPGLSVVIMLLLLATLARLFMMVQAHPPATGADKVFITVAFTFYFAWICVATIANITALLVHLDWNGGAIAPQTWTVIMMAVASALGAVVVWQYRAWAFVLVLLWALFGIYRRWDNGEYPIIMHAAVVLMAALIVLFIYCMRRPRVG